MLGQPQMKRFADGKEIPTAFLGLLTPSEEWHLSIPLGKAILHLLIKVSQPPTQLLLTSTRISFLLFSFKTQEIKTVVFATISHIQLYLVSKTVIGIRQLHTVGTCT